MRRFLILSAFVAGASFLATVALTADDAPGKHYYDRDGRDYHRWNAQEDRAYRAYLEGQHREYREFRKVGANQQGEYFKWRHDHPDGVPLKIEIR